MQRIIQKYKALTAVIMLLALCAIAPLGRVQASALPMSSICTKNNTGCTAIVADAPANDCEALTSCTLISQYIDPFVNFLSAAIGVGVVISIVVGGIQYSSSAGDPGKASAAKNRIRNAIIALVTFMLLYGMLNFLIPGGFGLLK
jgi:hypothetical protein